MRVTGALLDGWMGIYTMCTTLIVTPDLLLLTELVSVTNSKHVSSQGEKLVILRYVNIIDVETGVKYVLWM